MWLSAQHSGFRAKKKRRRKKQEQESQESQLEGEGIAESGKLQKSIHELGERIRSEAEEELS